MNIAGSALFQVAQDASAVANVQGGVGNYIPSILISEMPDKILLQIFSFLKHRELGKIARVCKKWRLIAYDSRLWQAVSLRPEFSGLHINSIEALLALVNIRFGNTLRYIELPCELITAPVLHDLANKCPNLKYMTLDFSNAMQLHDFNDLNAFPCNLRSLCLCLSEVIFLEGFMRRIYSCLSSLEVLHLIGTFELSSDAEEENYEVINISKIKAHTPNLRIVNMYGIGFIDDSHVEMLASNCIHLEVLALNFCLRVKGSSFNLLVQKCKKLKTLLLQHTAVITSNMFVHPRKQAESVFRVHLQQFATNARFFTYHSAENGGVEDAFMMAVPWEQSIIHELDLTSTELATECLENMLLRIPGFTYLGLGHCEFFSDSILEKLMEKGKFHKMIAIDISYTNALSESAIYNFLLNYGSNLRGLMLSGKPKLTENFWLNVIPFLKNIRICGLGTANGWFLRINTRVHIDQVIEGFAQHCGYMDRLEIQWDPDTIRFSDKSNKFVDHIRLRCPHLRSITLSDGEYYEMVKSNFERADRKRVVRTTINYSTSIVSLLTHYNDLLFN